MVRSVGLSTMLFEKRISIMQNDDDGSDVINREMIQGREMQAI